MFEPLGLRRTSFEPGDLHGDYVHGYRAPSHQGVVTGAPVDIGAEPAWWTWAAGGIVSTPGDVQRFFAALLRGRVLGPAVLREMETLVPAGRQRYGLGIATFPTPCGSAWGHTGNVQGTVAVAWNTRDASRQLVLVVNTYPLSGGARGGGQAGPARGVLRRLVTDQADAVFFRQLVRSNSLVQLLEHHPGDHVAALALEVDAVGGADLLEPPGAVGQVLGVAAVVAGEHRVRVDVGRAPLALPRLLLHDRVDDVEPLRLLGRAGLRKPDPDDERAGAVDRRP